MMSKNAGIRGTVAFEHEMYVLYNHKKNYVYGSTATPEFYSTMEKAKKARSTIYQDYDIHKVMVSVKTLENMTYEPLHPSPGVLP